MGSMCIHVLCGQGVSHVVPYPKETVFQHHWVDICDLIARYHEQRAGFPFWFVWSGVGLVLRFGRG